MAHQHGIDLSSDDRARLEAVVAVARQIGKAQPTVLRWRQRFAAEGVDGLLRDRTRPPGTQPVPPAEVRRVLELTAGEPPAVPAGKVVHVILDNYATHKPPKVRAWLGRHPRFVFHLTPTSCSCLNAVEQFFSKLSRRRLRRGSFVSLVDLQAAIHRFITEHNREAAPFAWTADPHGIIERVHRAQQASASVH